LAQTEASASVNSDAGAVVEDNTVNDNGSERLNDINGSFGSSAAGTLNVQQNNGSINTVQAATAVNAELADVGDIVTTSSVRSTTRNNTVDHTDTTGASSLLDRDNNISGSFGAFQGVANVQQNNGDANEVGAAMAVTATTGDVSSITQNATTDGETTGNTGDGGGPITDPGSRRANTVGSSFGSSAGSVTVQQNNGNANAMSVATAIAAAAQGAGAVDQTAEAFGDLSDMTLEDDGSNRTNDINNSFDSAAGMHTVQQNNGDGNVLGAANAVVGEPDSETTSVTQTSTTGTVDILDIETDDAASTRRNTINPSYNSSTGVMTVQQNNGNANVVTSANAVTGVVGSTGDVTQNASTDAFLTTLTLDDSGSNRDNGIANSFDSSSGRMSVQQNNGDGNSMGTASAVVAADGSGTGNVDVEQTVTAAGDVDNFDIDASGGTRDNDVTDSFDSASGTYSVQQNNGNGNSVQSSFGVAAVRADGGETSSGPAEDVVTQKVTASGVVGDEALQTETVSDEGSTRANRVTDSASGFSGEMTLQQNNGDANALSAATAVTVNTGDGDLDDVLQDVSTDGVVEDLETISDARQGADGDRDNSISNSFGNASGFQTVQQNNGSANAILASTGVSVDEATGSDGNLENVTQQLSSTEGRVENVETVEETAAANDDADRSNAISSSFTGSAGITTVQENNGDANVIGSSIAVAATIAGDDIDTVDDTDVSTTGAVTGNAAFAPPGGTVLNDQANRDNDITGSFNGASGILNVQQNNGSLNVLGAAVGVTANDVAASADGGVTAAASSTGTVSNNDPLQVEGQPDHTNDIGNSFNSNFAGVGNVTQNNGDGNVIGQSVSVTASNTSIGGSGWGTAVSTAELNGTVTNNTVVMDGFGQGPQFSNGITSSFSGATGAFSVVQNNGNGNVVQSAITVTANY
jgi:hypothetical protein